MIASPMTEQGKDLAALLARRECRRRRIRRRRLLAAGGLVFALAALIALFASLLGGSSGRDRVLSGHGSQRANSAGRDGADRPGATGGPVRNATPQPDWGPHTGPVPILEWHVLGSPAPGVPYPDLYVSRPDFRDQVDWLDRHGYQAVTLEQVEDAWWREATLPRRPVVLSFDDGYRPQFTFALPELRRHGWAGVLNLKAGGSDLYPSNVEAMIASGWELASHTIDHSDLSTLSGADLEREVAGSRRILRREYGVPVRSFCYPAGRYDEAAIAAVRAAGYTTATTQIPGYATRRSPLELARLEVLGSAGVSGMVDLLRAYEA
jgi:peptidoglycan/xylan/chitin deacetylase (PgdA/CDA1 family)